MIPKSNRKGMDRGRGSGYRNVLPNYDAKVHSLSAKGIKQPQRFRVLVTPEGADKQVRTNKTFKSKKEADNWAYVETIAGMGEVYDVKGGKYKPSFISAIENAITRYEKIKDKSNLSLSEKRTLNALEAKLVRVKPSKQLYNYAKKHKLLLMSAGAGLAISAGSMLGMKHTDPLSGGTMLAFPVGYMAYEGKLVNQLKEAEYNKLTTKFPHLSESERNELASRSINKKLYGGKNNPDYLLFYHKGNVYKVNQ